MSALPRVAPRMPRNSEGGSANGLSTQKAFFSNWVVVPRFLISVKHKNEPFQSRFLGRGCDEALFSGKKRFFSEKGGCNSVSEGFGEDLYRNGNSVKRSGPFSEPPDSEN